MLQHDVLNKLKAYLQLVAPETSKSIQENLVGPGFCFGYSLCDAGMELTGHLEWWDKVLRAIAAWDEKKETLDQIFSFSGYPNYKLQELMVRALNYIVPNQPPSHYSVYENFLPSSNGDTWTDIINYFEILDGKNIKKFESNKVIAGHFSENQLTQLLKPELLINNTVLVISPYHVIRISYKETSKYWVIYNSNGFSNTPMNHANYLSKEDFIKSIIAIQGSSLAFAMASFEKNKIFDVSPFDLMLENELPLLLQELGLHVMAHSASYLFPNIFEKAKKIDSLCETLRLALLKPGDANNNIGFNKIVFYSPLQIPILLQALEKHPDDFLKMLKYKNTRGSSGLRLSFMYCPQFIRPILLLAFQASQEENLLPFFQETLDVDTYSLKVLEDMFESMNLPTSSSNSFFSRPTHQISLQPYIQAVQKKIDEKKIINLNNMNVTKSTP